MAESKRRQRPKGGELRESLRGNPEQSYRREKRARQLQDRLTEQDVKTAGGALGAGAGAVAADVAGSIDPFLSRNEFKEGFYSQPSQPATTAETMYGKGTKRGFESPIVDPDTSMMQNMAEGGSVRGQKNIQVKKKQFRGVF
jgi:hypothetical protein